MFKLKQEIPDVGQQFSKRYQFCDLKPNELVFRPVPGRGSGGAIYVNGPFKYCHVQFGDTAPAPTIFDKDIDLVDMITGTDHLEDIGSDDCKKCRYRSVCTSGCPVYRVDGKDPHCSLYHRFISKYYELQAQERLFLLLG